MPSIPDRIIDTHIHIWDFDRCEYSWLQGNTTILNRPHHIEQLEEERKKVGISDGILVQAANTLEETRYMLEVAEETDWIKGVVGWVPLTDPSATQKILAGEFSDQKYFKGVRHLIHDEKNPAWLLRDEVLESLQVLADHHLPFDVVGVLPAHIETVLEVANRIPELKMVFDHLNQPPTGGKDKFGQWGELMKMASMHKNFYAKISGLGTAAKNLSWTKVDIQPCVEFVLEHFGIDRCFCGGDWPVSLLAGSYSRTWSAYRDLIDSLVEEKQRAQVYNSNAVEFYQLQKVL